MEVVNLKLMIGLENMDVKLKLVIIIAISFVLLLPAPIFASSHPEYSEEKCEELEANRKSLQEQYMGKREVSELSKTEPLAQIYEFTKQIKEFCTEPEIELPIVREITSQMRSQATIWCSDAQDRHHTQQSYGNNQFGFNWNNCIDDQLKILQSQPEPEPEPVITADDQYKIICSAPDGYCMSIVGMNNPDRYGACLEKWVPFCQTYDEKQTPVTNSEIVCGVGTVDVNGQCVVDTSKQESKSSKGGGCLIATATYGSELAPEVQKLRELRDNSLLSTESGTNFMNTFNDVYYSFSPVIADYERENPVFKEMVKLVITPMISSLSILNYVDMDSASTVLGYGISLIILNAMMYVGIPVLAIVQFRKYA